MTSPGNHHDELPGEQFHDELKQFSEAGFDMNRLSLKRNCSVAELYEEAIRKEGAVIASNGACQRS